MANVEQEQPQQSLLNKISRREIIRGLLGLGIVLGSGVTLRTVLTRNIDNPKPSAATSTSIKPSVEIATQANVTPDGKIRILLDKKALSKLNNILDLYVDRSFREDSEFWNNFLSINGKEQNNLDSFEDHITLETGVTAKDSGYIYEYGMSYWAWFKGVSDKGLYPPSFQVKVEEFIEKERLTRTSASILLRLDKEGNIIIWNDNPENLTPLRRSSALIETDVDKHFKHPVEMGEIPWVLSTVLGQDNVSTRMYKTAAGSEYWELVNPYNGSIVFRADLPTAAPTRLDNIIN